MGTPLGARELNLSDRSILFIKILFVVSVTSIAIVMTHKPIDLGSYGYIVVATDPNPFVPGIIVAALLTVFVMKTNLLQNAFRRIDYKVMLVTVFFFIGWCNINGLGKHNGQVIGPESMTFGTTLDKLLASFGGVDVVLFDSAIYYFSFIGAFLILFVVVSAIYPHISGFLKGLDRFERTFLVAGIILSLVVISVVFSLSTAYYGSVDDIVGTRNLIFTGDGSDVANGLYGIGRHPLYFIFSLPLTLFASCIYVFIPVDVAYYIAFQWATVFTMMLTILMVVRMLRLDGRIKIFAILFMAFSYSAMLNSLAVERSVLSAFYIVLAVYLVMNNRRESNVGFVGAAGTMTFSLALLPIALKERLYGPFLKNLLIMATVFLFLLCLSGDLYQMNSITSDASGNVGIWGNIGFEVPLLDTLRIFSVNLFAILLRPDTIEEGASYLMAPITQFSLIGIAILASAVLGFIVSRKDKYSKICFYWLLMSVLLLVVVGWGVKEGDGSILMVMFSWAYISLMIRLLLNISQRIPEKLTLAVMIMILAPMILYNLLGIYDLVEWSIRVWPR